MVANGNTGNSYQHTMQHGFGTYHSHGGYEGTASYCLGQASYCEMQRTHVSSSDSTGGWNGRILFSTGFA